MKYFINDIEQSAASSSEQSYSLAQILEAFSDQAENHKLTEQGFVVAVNQNFVPRSEYQNFLINEGDKIEVLSPMAGG